MKDLFGDKKKILAQKWAILLFHYFIYYFTISLFHLLFQSILLFFEVGNEFEVSRLALR